MTATHFKRISNAFLIFAVVFFFYAKCEQKKETKVVKGTEFYFIKQ